MARISCSDIMFTPRRECHTNKFQASKDQKVKSKLFYLVNSQIMTYKLLFWKDGWLKRCQGPAFLAFLSTFVELPSSLGQFTMPHDFREP